MSDEGASQLDGPGDLVRWSAKDLGGPDGRGEDSLHIRHHLRGQVDTLGLAAHHAAEELSDHIELADVDLKIPFLVLVVQPIELLGVGGICWGFQGGPGMC